MSKLWQRIRFLDSRGQSLVETALFLPIMIVMLLGIVEVSTLLINQNRVTTAGRIAAGYGAANFEATDWPILAADMGSVVRQTVTDTLNLSPDLWDVWSIYAQVNITGTGFTIFDARHVYGNQLIVSEAAWEGSVEAQVQSSLLAELQSNGGDISGLEFVVSIPYHDSATFLNLPIWQWSGFKTISGLTAMRVDRPVAQQGDCVLLPIGVRLNQPSLYPSNWPKDDNIRHDFDEGFPKTYYPTDSSPNDKFDNVHPSNKPWDWPTYLNTGTAPDLVTENFTRNVPGVSLANAQPGYLFRAREEEDATPGGFGWLCWREPCSNTATDNSLSYLPLPPGNFMEMYPGSRADRRRDQGGYTTPLGTDSGNGNGQIEIGEWLRIGQGNQQNHADTLLADYIKDGRPVTLMVYDFSGGAGNEKMFRVWDFAVMKFVATGFTGTDKFLIFEFVKWSTECVPTTN